ncbi:MAG: ABC transporter ATP-binding protein [Termitinemataceae bacterium]|nr:MAG: ABC transporter ATP-binding protein [Termitinemataceae bacterium]
MPAQPYIEMRHITKRFCGVLANDDVSLYGKCGSILSLLGENGCGKSTLMNMLSGIYIPDEGEIFIDGKKCFFRSPQDAIDAGIGMVHQHFKLISVMSAWENISLGEKTKNIFIDKKRINKKISDIEKRFGIVINHDKKVYDMSVGEKQNLEIIKVLYRGARVLILDEPTAVLTPQETKQLFVMLRRMKSEGCAIIIITHKLNEVMEISDRVMVMRRGRSIDTVETSATSAQVLTEMMVGESISLEIKREAPQKSDQSHTLKVKNIFCKAENGLNALSNISFELYGGEILGVAGIAGSGQRELCEIIAGLRKACSGEITFDGKNIIGLSAKTIRQIGISMSFVPEDRLGMGLVAGMSITDNILLRSFENNNFFIDRKRGRNLAEGIVKRYDIATPSVAHIVRKLSGGNIQKVLLGREIELQPLVLVTAYPVRGLDIGASYSIYRMLNEQKKKGVAVLYIGEDLDVLRQLCDRLMVLHGGSVMGIVDPRTCTKEKIGAMMLGENYFGDELN